MKVNPDLEQAIDIFKKLGWNTASFDEVMTLPLGTPEQQKIALKGLRTGDWDGYGTTDSGRWGWISAIDVNSALLALFATRIGVGVKRAIEVLPSELHELKAAIIQERGEKFAGDFVTEVFTRNRGNNVFMDEAALEVVLRMGLDHPKTEIFYGTWARELRRALDNGINPLPSNYLNPHSPQFSPRHWICALMTSLT